jgi:hypothetical protein
MRAASCQPRRDEAPSDGRLGKTSRSLNCLRPFADDAGERRPVPYSAILRPSDIARRLGVFATLTTALLAAAIALGALGPNEAAAATGSRSDALSLTAARRVAAHRGASGPCRRISRVRVRCGLVVVFRSRGRIRSRMEMTMSAARAVALRAGDTGQCVRLSPSAVRCGALTLRARGGKMRVGRRPATAPVPAAAAPPAVTPHPAPTPRALPAAHPPPPPVLPTCRVPGEPLAWEDTVAELERQAERVVPMTRSTASDGTTVYFPDGARHYRAFWVRDFAYVARAGEDLIPTDDLAAGFRFLLAGQRADGAMPDRITAAGRPIHLVLGERPPTDNPSFMVDLVWQHFQRTGSPDLFADHADDLARGLRSIPREGATGLVWVAPSSPHSSYGFTDSIGKTGRELFTSLLFLQAAERMAAMYQATGAPGAATPWRDEAARIRASLDLLWSPKDSMFLAASHTGQQIDVWGSAFAVAEGLVTGPQATAIAAWLRSHLDGIARGGQIRHLPAGERWQNVLLPELAGIYQDGSYWATATGWVATAIAPSNLAQARQLLSALAGDMKRWGVNEYVGGPEQHCEEGIKDYGSSTTLPLVAARALAAR